MNRLLTIPAVLALLSMVGCVSIESNVDPDFEGPLDRTFIALQSGTGYERLAEEMGAALRQELEERGVAAEVYVRDDLSLEMGNDVSERVEAFGPDAVLIVGQTGASYYNGAKSGASFEAMLVVPGAERAVWRAVISSNTSGYGGAGSPTQIAGKIVAQMEKDGLFTRGS